MKGATYISKHKYAAVLLLILAALLSVGAFLAVRMSRAETKKETTDLFTAEGFTVEKGVYNADSERSGILLTAKSDFASAVFGGYSANFDLDFALAGNAGASRFDTIAFTFTDAATGKSFSLTFLENGPYGNVRVAHQGVTQYWTLDGVSFTGGLLGVDFDGRDMTLSMSTESGETKLFDFSSESDMANLGAVYTLDSFDEYSVTVSVSGIKANDEAQVYLYALSGESLASGSLADTAGAEICGEPQIYVGCVNEKYYVSSDGLFVFDLVDGRSDFDGEVAVTDKNGESVALDGENAFVPQSAGQYAAEYRAKDSKGNYGAAVKYNFTIATQAKGVQWEMQFPVYEGSVTAGTQVVLPGAAAVSAAAGENSPALSTAVEVLSPSGAQVLSASASGANVVALTDAGTYTVRYSAVDYSKKTQSVSYSITVTAGSPIERDIIAEEMLTGSYLYLKDAKSGGKTLKAEAESPDGSVSDFPKILLDTAGVWTVRYYDGDTAVFEDYIRVRLSAEDLWETVNSVNVAAGTQTPDYYDFEATGLEISASLPSGQAFFKNPVDLSSKTKNDKLIEFLVTPAKQEVLELDRLELIIRDAYDEDNYITIAFEPNVWGYRQLTTVTVSTSAGQTYAGEFLMCTTLYGKFTGGKISTDPIDYDPIITKPIAVYWDGAENAIYMSPSRSDLNRSLVIDLDDPATFGAGNEWKGFSSGEAEIGFLFREINDTAHILVTEFDGMDFGGGAVADSAAPSVRVTDSNAVGLVGANYDLPVAYGVDSVDGVINDVSVEVRFVNGNIKTSVPMTGLFSFTPDKVGRYEVVYTVSDRAGNTGMRILYVDVAESLDPIRLTEDLEAVYPSELTVGDRLLLQEIEAVGGSGTLVCTKYLFSDGDMQELTGKSVLLTQAGTYMLRYSVTDYLGNTVNFDMYMRVDPSEGPVFENTTVPSYVLAGKDFVLPDITATDYANGGAQAQVELFVDGVKKSAGETITAEKDFVLKAVATSGSARSEKTYEIKVVSPRSDENFIADYFVTDAAISKSVSSGGVAFTATADGKIVFVNALPMYDFSMSLAAAEGAFGSGTLAITFTDYENADISVVIRLKEENGAIFYGINGGAMRQTNGSFSSVSGYSFGIVGTALCDADGNPIAEIGETLLGDAFAGFTDGKAYLSFAFEGVKESASVTVKQICNQVIGNTASDRIKPMIVFRTEMVRIADKGSKVVLPDVVAVDVLDSEVSFGVLITAPDDSVIFDGNVEDFEGFTADLFGVYYLTFTAKDSAGNTQRSYASVQVFNYEVPEISVGGEVPATLKKGENFTVPAASAAEGITLKIYLVSPDGVRREVTVGEKITAERSGTYRLMFYAYNSDYSSNLIVKEIAVS